MSSASPPSLTPASSPPSSTMPVFGTLDPIPPAHAVAPVTFVTLTVENFDDFPVSNTSFHSFFGSAFEYLAQAHERAVTTTFNEGLVLDDPTIGIPLEDLVRLSRQHVPLITAVLRQRSRPLRPPPEYCEYICDPAFLMATITLPLLQHDAPSIFCDRWICPLSIVNGTADGTCPDDPQGALTSIAATLVTRTLRMLRQQIPDSTCRAAAIQLFESCEATELAATDAQLAEFRGAVGEQFRACLLRDALLALLDFGTGFRRVDDPATPPHPTRRRR